MSAKPKKSRSCTALVAEDEIEGARIEKILENLGLEVLLTTQGSHALELFYTVRPDLMVLDVALPGLTGWEIIQTIRNKHHGVEEPGFIFVTDYHDVGNRVMARLQGVFANYLKKPASAQDLEAAVNRVVPSCFE